MGFSTSQLFHIFKLFKINTRYNIVIMKLERKDIIEISEHSLTMSLNLDMSF